MERTAYTNTAVAPSGSLETTSFPDPVNYEVDGEWRPIQRELVPKGSDGDVHPHAMDGDLAIPASLEDPIEVSLGDNEVSYRLIGAGGDREVEGSAAQFDDAFRGVDATYESRSTGLKESIVLKDRSAPRVFRYELTGDSRMTATRTAGNVVEVRDHLGLSVFRIVAPLAWDSSVPASLNENLSLEVEKKSPGRWILTMRADGEWLDAPSTTYPVTLDPEVIWTRPDSQSARGYGANADCYILEGSANSFCSAPTLRVGGINNAEYRSLVMYNLASVIPDYAVVEKATLGLYFPPEAITNRPAAAMRAWPVTSSWGPDVSWTKRNSTTPWTSAGGDVSSDPELSWPQSTSVPGPGVHEFPIKPAVVQGWVDGSLPNYGLELKTEPGRPFFPASSFRSSDDVGNPGVQKPSLTVTWYPTVTDDIKDVLPDLAQAWALDTGAADFGCSEACYLLRTEEPPATAARSGRTASAARTATVASPSSPSPNFIWDVPETFPEDWVRQRSPASRWTPRTGSVPPPNSTVTNAIRVERTAAQMAGRNAFRMFATRAAATLIPGGALVMAGSAVGYLVIEYATKNGGNNRVVMALPGSDMLYNWIPSWQARWDVRAPNTAPLMPPGYVAQFWYPGNLIMTRGWRTHRDPGCTNNPLLSSFPAGAQVYGWLDGPHCDHDGDGSPISWGLYMSYTTMLSQGTQMPEPPPSGQVTWANAAGHTVPATQAEAEELISDALGSGGPQLNAKLNATLGRGVDPEYPSGTLPDCAGLTAAACQSVLEAAGFVGKLTITTIPTDQANPDSTPGTVEFTQPGGGKAHNKHADIVITKNPDAPTPVPPYLPEEQDLADELINRNPEVAQLPTKPLRRPRALQIARQCIKRTVAAAISSDRCKFRPILIVGGADALGPALHNLEAIDPAKGGHPKWVQLHRRRPSPRVAPFKEWYRRIEPCKSENLSLAWQCDEYPFASSTEGYYGPATSPMPSTKAMDGGQNRREGNVIGHFYSANGITAKMPFAGCGRQLRPNPAPTTPDVQDPPLPDSDYLVISLPNAAIPSMGLCNLVPPIFGHSAWTGKPENE